MDGFSPEINQVKHAPDAPKAGSSELETIEQKAERIAQLTRAEGMGYLHGKFPHILENETHGYFQTVEGFIKGWKIEKSRPDNELLFSMFPPETHLPYEVWNSQTYGHRQVWTAKPYSQKKQEYEVKTGMFKKEKRVHIPNYKGETGPETGVQYDYYMPVSSDYDTSHRPGCVVNMSVVVPEHIASMIDGVDLQQHPDFPDRFFKALYPDLVGPDTRRHITRLPATELFVRDLRKNPNQTEGKVISYPKPIPY